MTAQEAPARAPRRRLEVVTGLDGKRITLRERPRADVLWYPRVSWTTVLVRRTHDLDLAREMAEKRWAEITDERPLTGGTRIGWWRTYTGREAPDDAAVDPLGRVVQWATTFRHGVGAGIEFRP